jgi:hypothetical protein
MKTKPIVMVQAIGLILLCLTAAMFVSESMAQPQVRCANIMYPDTIQIFSGMSCPQGWYPV